MNGHCPLSELTSIGAADDTIEAAAGRTEAVELVGKIRGGTAGTYEVREHLQRAVLNAFAPARLDGFAAVLVAELRKGSAT